MIHIYFQTKWKLKRSEIIAYSLWLYTMPESSPFPHLVPEEMVKNPNLLDFE